jgi:hypothetical protein
LKGGKTSNASEEESQETSKEKDGDQESQQEETLRLDPQKGGEPTVLP